MDEKSIEYEEVSKLFKKRMESELNNSEDDAEDEIETRVYSVKTEKLIWAGKTKSVNASSSETVIKELAALVIKDMKNSGLIK